jgi:homocitrate synthase NifV
MPVIVDTTLRDGLQMPGVRMTLDQKLTVLGLLAETGITDVEIGCPGQGPKAVEELRQISSRYSSINCSVWCRALKQDIDSALECGAATIHISFPVSDRHMQIASFSRTEVLDRLRILVAGLHHRDGFVTVGAQDATRADIGFLKNFVAAAIAAGAQRVRIADTVGISTPESAVKLIRTLHNHCPEAALEYHGHNDFGLAAATTLAVIEAGVEAVSVTVNGIGERAGNAAIEEVVSAAVMLYGYESSLHLEKLDQLSKEIADMVHVPLSPCKPISGNNAFRHESGIHCHGMLRDQLAYQPFTAEEVGRKTIYSLGPQSGSSSVQAVMKNKGIPIDRTMARKLWERYHEYLFYYA